MAKFTFKTDKPTGRFRSFFGSYTTIKLKGVGVGGIQSEGRTDVGPFRIRFQVTKADINEDGNTNCPWKWVTMKKQCDTLQEAKDWTAAHTDEILAKLPVYTKGD